jgi:peptide/nickel transport system permease protein
MWAFIVRKVIYYIPVYLGILLLTMAALRVRDPVSSYLGKNASQQQIDLLEKSMGLDQPFIVQYITFVWDVVTLDFGGNSWQQKGKPVSDIVSQAIVPSLSITVPTVAISAVLAVAIGLISSYYRGRAIDRTLVVLAVLGMSISYLVFIIFGQFFGAFWPQHAEWAVRPFAIAGYEPWIGWDGDSAFFHPQNWVRYCLLPVLIGVVVALGYDTRFYRAVMVEESGRDYITTALAKGVGRNKILFVHMLKNAMIPLITRVMTTLPFLITGSILAEMYFQIPGMGRTLITAILNNDFPVVQAIVAVLAAIFIASIILTDVLYALVDPRVRLS